MKVNISEIFSSVQGEGRWTGHPAIFIRFAGCSVGCAFCDTKNAQQFSPAHNLQKDNLHTYNVERSGDNWTTVSVQEVYEYVADLIEQSAEDRSKRIQVIVITGGEPFEQAQALGELCVKLPYLSHKDHGVTDNVLVCVESSGTTPLTCDTEDPNVTDNTVENVLMHIYNSEYCFLTVSPKYKKTRIEYMYAASQLKFLVGHKPELDVEIPLEVFKELGERTEGLAFQPIWDENSVSNTQEATRRAINKARIYGGVLSVQVHKYIGIR